MVTPGPAGPQAHRAGDRPADGLRPRAATPCRRARLRQEQGLDAVQHISELAHRQRCRGAHALRGKQAPTALFCSNDLLATAVIADLVGLGCRCPPTSRSAASTACASAPAHAVLTTVAPSDGIGQAACSNLLAQIHGQPAQSNRLPHCIVVGGGGGGATLNARAALTPHGFFMLIAQITDLHAHAGRQGLRHHRPAAFLGPARAQRAVGAPIACSSPAT